MWSEINEEFGEPKERRVIKKFKGSSKYIRYTTYFAVTSILLGIVLFFSTIEQFNLKDATNSIGVFLIQTSVTVAIINIILLLLLESPIRHLIDDAERELREFATVGSSSQYVLVAIQKINNGSITKEDIDFFSTYSAHNLDRFKSLKGRHQVARASSKDLGQKFWGVELIAINEEDFFSSIKKYGIERMKKSNAINILWNKLEMISDVYSGETGDLPRYPVPHQAEEIRTTIRELMGPKKVHWRT